MSSAGIFQDYRSINAWRDQAIQNNARVHVDFGGEMAAIGQYLDQPRFRGLRYRYFQTPGNAEYQKMYREIPLRNVMDYANTLMRPVFTDFTEVNEDEEFMEISGKFFYELFIQENIYVTYNVFEGGTDYFFPKAQDDKGLNNSETQRIVWAIREKGGYDIWVKLNEDEYSKNIEFMHVDTGLVVKFPKWREQMANCKWSAVPQGNLTNWMNIAGIELALTKYLDSCTLMCGKKLIFTTQGQSDAQKEQLEEMLASFKNYFHFNLKNQADIEPLIAFEGDDLVAIRDTIFQMLDRLKFEYGRVANTNPKGERITSGENYKDISAIGNRQKETLEYLIYFQQQVQKKFNRQLNFAVSGIPEKEAVYSVAHLAQNPNMEKEMFGQVEGTADRPPLGQKGLRQVGMQKGIKKSNKGQGSWSH